MQVFWNSQQEQQLCPLCPKWVCGQRIELQKGSRLPKIASRNFTANSPRTEQCWTRPFPLRAVFGFLTCRKAVWESGSKRSRGRSNSPRVTLSTSPMRVMPSMANTRIQQISSSPKTWLLPPLTCRGPPEAVADEQQDSIPPIDSAVAKLATWEVGTTGISAEQWHTNAETHIVGPLTQKGGAQNAAKAELPKVHIEKPDLCFGSEVRIQPNREKLPNPKL